MVLVEDGRIAAVGTAVDPGHDIHDLGSVTLMPGLVDCHQHLVFDGAGSLEEQVVGCSDDELRSRAYDAARTAVLGGVTTVRDLGDRNYVTLDLRGDPDLPTILCSGPPITTVGGHCWFLGGECSTRDEMIAAVCDRLERGCDVVKIMATGGFLTPATPMWKSQFGLEDLKLVVREAHAAGVAVAAHCHGLQGIGDAIDAGVDTIEHCTFLNESMHPAPAPALLDRLAASDTVISATIGSTPDTVHPEEIERILPGVFDALSAVRSRGGQIVVGSDAGINPFKPHDVARYAIHDLHTLGMGPIEALQTMTRDGADALSLPAKGRIEVAADADLMAVDGDPETDPDALTRVVQVWRAGTPLHPIAGAG